MRRRQKAEGAEKDDGDNDGNQGGEKGEKPSVEEQGEPAPKKKKMDCECADEQCYCGKKFETIAYLNLHIQRKHKTTWMCSGQTGLNQWKVKKRGTGRTVAKSVLKGIPRGATSAGSTKGNITITA